LSRAFDAVELTRRLIRFDTVNPPGNERPCAEFLAKLLEDANFHISLSDFGAGRASLIATCGSRDNVPPLMFTGHIDVVPLGTRAWSHDPFSADEGDGRIHGRGASDMKSGVAAMVCAALDAAKEARPPNLMLVVTAGEETGCAGANALVAEGRLGRAAAIVVGEPTGNALCVGHKGALWLKAITTGIAAHGSMPERGDNAIYKAARVIRGLQTFAFDAPAHPMLGRPTLSVNTVHGGSNINSVPDRTEIGVDIRTVPAVNHAQLRQRLQQVVGDEARIEAIVDVPGVWTAPEDEWVQRPQRRRGCDRSSVRARRGDVFYRCLGAHAGDGPAEDDHPRPGRAFAGAPDGRMVQRRADSRGGRDLRAGDARGRCVTPLDRD
jgi:succinyl-diaminopimelate desuccinylase